MPVTSGALHSPPPPVREKIVLLYEEIFEGRHAFESTDFWNEFFLLWPNGNAITELVHETVGDHSANIACEDLFVHSVNTICDETNIRTVNAIQTVCILLNATGGQRLAPTDCLLKLLDRLCYLICQHNYPSLRTLSLKALLVSVTCSGDLSGWLLDGLMTSGVFEAIIHLLSSPILRQQHGQHAVLLLALLVNYAKYEASSSHNPYIGKLSILDDDLPLNGFSQAISSVLSDYNKCIKEQLDASETQGIFSTLTNMLPGESHNQLLINNESCGDHVIMQEPTTSNLLVSFFTYCSVIMQDLKSDRNENAAKLCMIILTCIAEDHYANTLMHDLNMSFRVPLYRAPMRHRRAGLERSPRARPLCCALLDLCCEFILSHLMKNLPFHLHIRCLGIIQRIISYERKCRIRVQYEWSQLWNTLASLLRFLSTNEAFLLPKYNIFIIAQKTICILNLFITFGDTFLPSANLYDLLYYEVIRHASTFQHLYSLALRCSVVEDEFRDGAVKLCNDLVNIRSILNHFQPKIGGDDGSSVLNEQQILEIVRNNYDSLSLKLQDNLDVFERYNEKPQEGTFFTQIVSLVISDTKKRLSTFEVDHKTILNELKMIDSEPV